MKYDAFISYRHSPLDMEIAKKVHTGLETYRIPGSVKKKTGKKKMGRVFRDQEELPIGSDLGDNIEAALSESEYLIVICSPRTPESYWVCKEIETFIKLHDREHVLAVLIEGEPDESFPKALLTDDLGNSVEPLAADVRGADKKERNKKFATELLRLAAPVIGCTYDELRQRHRERIVKRTITIASSIALVVALAGTAFGIYNADVAGRMKKLAEEKSTLADEKSHLANEITNQYRENQINQSKFYAEESRLLFSEGDREDAVLVAMEGLPGKGNERPYVANPEIALGDALYAYECNSGLGFERILRHNLAVTSSSVSCDKKKLVTIDTADRVYVWNSEDWKMLGTIEPVLGEDAIYRNIKNADADDTGIYVAYEDALIKYDYEGNVIYDLEGFETVRQVFVIPGEKKIFLACKADVKVIDINSGKLLDVIENKLESGFISGRYFDSCNKLLLGRYNEDDKHSVLAVIDGKSNEVTDLTLSEGFWFDSYITDENNIAVICCNNGYSDIGIENVYAELFDMTGKRLWSKKLDFSTALPTTFSAMIKSHSHDENGEKVSEIIAIAGTTAHVLDERSGDIISSFTLPDDATMLIVNLDTTYGRIGYSSGGIDFVDFAQGRFVPQNTFDTNCEIREGHVIGSNFIIDTYESPEVRVLTWHEAPDSEEIVTFDRKFSPVGISEDGEYFVERPSDEYSTLFFYDKDGKELFSYDKGDFITMVKLTSDKAYFVDKRTLITIDPYGKTVDKINLEDYGVDMGTYDCTLSDSGERAVFWDTRDIYVLDIKNKKILASGRTDSSINTILISHDDKIMYISESGSKLYAFDIEKGKNLEFRDDDLRTVFASFDEKYLDITRDGRYIAMCCRDGYARVVDTSSMGTYAKIPIQTYREAFAAFTDDGTHLILQGDDYRIRIYDMATRTIQNTIDTNATLSFITCDDKNGKVALCSGYGVLLCETEGYGAVARVPRGMFYVKNNASFLMNADKMAIKRAYYKNYEQLFEEAKKQFPDAKLTDEELIKYNIGR